MENLPCATLLLLPRDAGGTVLIPSFAVGRAQEILFHMRELEDEGEIPVLPVYVDSPMAVDAFEIYREHEEEHDLEMNRLKAEGKHPMRTKNVSFVRTVQESKAINEHQLSGYSCFGEWDGDRRPHCASPDASPAG